MIYFAAKSNLCMYIAICMSDAKFRFARNDKKFLLHTENYYFAPVYQLTPSAILVQKYFPGRRFRISHFKQLKPRHNDKKSTLKSSNVYFKSVKRFKSHKKNIKMKLTFFAFRWKSQQHSGIPTSLAKLAFFTGNPARPCSDPDMKKKLPNAQKRCAVVLWSPYLRFVVVFQNFCKLLVSFVSG